MINVVVSSDFMTTCTGQHRYFIETLLSRTESESCAACTTHDVLDKTGSDWIVFTTPKPILLARTHSHDVRMHVCVSVYVR